MRFATTIDKNLCKACGTCREECSQHLPVYNGADPPENAVACNGCLHCYAVCPEGAVTLTGETQLKAPADHDNPVAFLTANRRSCRRYKDIPIDEELLERIIRTASYIPSGGNNHAHEVTVLTSSAVRSSLEQHIETTYRKKKRLLDNHILRFIGMAISDAETRAFIRDRFYRRQISYLLEQFDRGKDPIFYRAPAVLLIHSNRLIPTPKEDCILAAYNMVLFIESIGLASCFVSLAQKGINSSPKLKRLLGMQPHTQVHAVIVAGYPAVTYHRPIFRAPVHQRHIDNRL